MTELKADRADEEAREIANHFGSCLIEGRAEENLRQSIVDVLRPRDTQLAEARERIRALEGALGRSADYLDDIASSLARSMPGASCADLVRDCARRARTILSPATELRVRNEHETVSH